MNLKNNKLNVIDVFVVGGSYLFFHYLLGKLYTGDSLFVINLLHVFKLTVVALFWLLFVRKQKFNKSGWFYGRPFDHIKHPAVCAGIGGVVIIIFQGLRNSLSLWPGILLSSVAFGVYHNYALPGQVLTGILGFVLAILYQRKRSLWSCILCHVILNGVGFVLLVIGIYAGK